MNFFGWRIRIIVVAALAALATVGAISATAGPALQGGPDEGVTAENGEGEEGGDAAELDGEDSEGAEHVAQVIADEFGATQEDVLALHDEGIGFGALFKLYALADAMGMTVDELLASIHDGEGGDGFAFGKLKNALTEEQMEIFEAGPKNLGKLVSDSHGPDGDDGDGPGATGLEQKAEKAAANAQEGHGPPDHAKAHGRD